MQSDEEQIRGLVSKWMSATKAGDTETVLSLMTDDVISSLQAGRPRERRICGGGESPGGPHAPRFEGTTEIQRSRLPGSGRHVDEAHGGRNIAGWLAADQASGHTHQLRKPRLLAPVARRDLLAGPPSGG